MAAGRPLGRVHVDPAGARRLRATLKAAGRDVGDLKAAHLQAAELVAARARQTAPVGPAPVHVRDTIRASGTATAAIIRAGKARVDYALSVHWGYQHSPDHDGIRTVVKANPWIAKAAQDLAPRWMPIYLAALQQIIDSVEGTTTP